MTGEAPQDLAERIKDALRLVIDPELGCNIVDLGLVYDVAVKEGGIAHITMTTTTQGCPATRYLAAGARDAAASVPAVESVEVALTFDPLWTPRMMSVQAKRDLGIPEEAEW